MTVPPVTDDPKNLVTDPPIRSPALLPDGRFTRAWSIWFKQLYFRTSYKGGNAIDNGFTSLNDTITQVNENENQIALNVTGIAQNVTDIAASLARIVANEGDIAANVSLIASNAASIAINASNILDGRQRVWGGVEPALYDDTGTSYAKGDTVTRAALGGANDFYYAAKEAIAAPAGVFDPAQWNKVALDSAWLTQNHIDSGSVRAISLSFEGTASVGAVTPDFSYNVDVFERVSIGVYEGDVLQSTFYGKDIFTKAVPVLSHSISASANTDFFEVEFTDLGSGDFRIEVYEVTKGAGSDLVRTLYDPDTAGDTVALTLLTDLGTGDLPTA